MKYSYVTPEDLKQHNPESTENVYLVHDDNNKLLAECYNEQASKLIVNSLNNVDRLKDTLNTIKEQLIDGGMNHNSVIIKTIDKQLNQ